MKSLLIILLACGLLFAMVVPAFAYDSDDYSYDEEETMPMWQKVLIALGVGLLVGLVTVLCLRSQLKSVKMQRSAANYIRPGSMAVTQSRDLYLYSTVTKVPLPKNNTKN